MEKGDIVMENKHINKELLNRYHNNQLSSEETASLLKHISECTYCADLFAESFIENDCIIPAPKTLKESILVHVAKKKSNASKRQLFFYSMRVCTAMCGALFLLFSTSWKDAMISNSPSTYTDAGADTFMDNMNESMFQFTNQINETMNTLIYNKQIKNNDGGNNND